MDKVEYNEFRELMGSMYKLLHKLHTSPDFKDIVKSEPKVDNELVKMRVQLDIINERFTKEYLTVNE